MFIFEHITGRPFEIKTSMDMYIYYYSCLLAGKEYVKTFDEFIDECDSDENYMKWFVERWTEHSKRQQLLNGKSDETASGEEESKKKIDGSYL